MIRRVLVTGTVALATLLGPAAGAALAAPPSLRAADATDATAPTLSTGSVRPGVSFTLTPSQSCPAADGEQVVLISYTDSEETTYQLATQVTDDDGSWDAIPLRIPVTGLDDTGSWLDAGVATGAGTIDVLCLNSDFVMAGASRTSFSPLAPDQRQAVLEDPDDDGDDPGDDAGDDNVTLTYAPAALTVAGKAAAVNVTPALAQPGDSITVAPVDVCAGTSARTARIQVSPATPGEDEDPGDDSGDDPGDAGGDDGGDGGDGVTGLGAEADPDAILTTEVLATDGTWPSTELKIPAGAPLGDYAVIVDCLDGGQAISSRYDAAPLALGTVVAGDPVCSAKGATVRLTGTYPDTLVTGDGDDLELPATLRLSGAGPWNVSLDSSLTEGLVLKKKISCPEPDYELTVPKTAVSTSGAVRARICNTGDASARALLQVAAKGKKFVTVDRQTLDDGDCAWLDGGKVKKGGSARARVLLDPPGQGVTDQEVSKSFTVRRKG